MISTQTIPFNIYRAMDEHETWVSTWGKAGKQADLTLEDLSHYYMPDFDFSYAILKGVDFTGADLDGCNFTGAILDHAKFNGTSLVGANFTNATLKNTKFERCALDHSIFDKYFKKVAKFVDIDLSKVSFQSYNFLQEWVHEYV